MEHIRIVLLQTSHPGNIGAVARAMKNMRLHRLVLVNPDHFPHPQAEFRASGATDVLAEARVVATFDEAVGDCALVVGTSARSRTIPWPVCAPDELADRVFGEYRGRDVAIVFGREERGLTNEELQRCHWHLHIPANPDYSALNLAMAVQIVTYELHRRWLRGQADLSPLPASLQAAHGPGWDEEPATVDDVERFIHHLEDTLVKIGFHDPDNPRQLMPRLRRLYQRAGLDKMEINILRGMLKAVQQKIV